MNSIHNFDNWYNNNQPVLQYLYYYLIETSKKYGINIITTDEAYNDYVDMMFNESNGYIVDHNDYPEHYF